MFDKIIYYILRQFCPMGGSEFFLYAAYAAAATGAVITTIDTVNANKRRQMILEEELRSAELAALDEENRRLQQLRLANDEMLARSGGVDAWASPSLVAARAFNFEMGMQDISNIRYNIQADRSGIAARIGILKQNSRATIAAGIFEVAGIAAGAKHSAGLLTKTPPKGTKAISGSGINKKMGVGILDTPGGTGVLT
jgi:heme exporter protein D